MFIYHSQLAITGKAYKAKIFNTKTGKSALRFSLRFYNSKLVKFYSVVCFNDAEEMFDKLVDGTPVTIFGRLQLNEFNEKLDNDIVADKVLLILADEEHMPKTDKREDATEDITATDGDDNDELPY